MREDTQRRGWLPGWLAMSALLLATLSLGGCMMIGPDYVKPDAPIAEQWREVERPEVDRQTKDLSQWWTVFNDPALQNLVLLAYQQNLSLRAAGLRVIAAQARRGIAIGNLFPQRQEAFGSYNSVGLSENRANQDNPMIRHNYNDWQLGFDAGWELDVWGRFRRGIESSDAQLLASLANYDDVLVSLVAEVARNYLELRTLQERLAVQRDNVGIQNRSLEIADTRFRNGIVTELDPAQARSLLRSTEASIPGTMAAIRQSENSLSVLLGMPPSDLQELLTGDETIPSAAPEVAVGLPAELLRQRPDIRRAERRVAAQSARIGVAVSDLYPRFFLVGTLSVTADDFAGMFKGSSFEAFGGPTFQWSILNYGRIRNNIRVQDALFQEAAVNYENTVLRAQEEVESSIAGYLGALRRVEFLTDGVDASQRAVDISNLQYREGMVDYIRVLNAQQVLLGDQERLVTSRGAVAFNLVALYKALGGGWQLRVGQDVIPAEMQEEMRARTNWGDLLTTEGQEKRFEDAASGTETERGWWRWRWWLPW